MKLTVTTNWADDFIDRISKFEEIECIKGRLCNDEIGGQLSFLSFSKYPTRKTIEKTIKRIHAIGKKFSYAIDGHCLGNKEYTWEGQKKILDFIKWISDSGADSVTVVIPHLIEVVKGQFPNLSVDFGSSRTMGEMQMIKYFDRLGVDSIALNPNLNRNFVLLKLFKKAVDCQLKLTLNSLCLYYCNFANDHENLLAHTSNFTTQSKCSLYYNHICNQERLKNHEEIIKAPFIRPEDIGIYESCGYEHFIIEPNSSKTDDTVNLIKAYLSRAYEGNLCEIMSSMGEKPFQDNKGRIGRGAPRLDNSKLTGFLGRFSRGNESCYYSICGVECTYCKEWAKKAISYSDKKKHKELISNTARRINKIEDGIYA